jgi:Type ISP C-terminal specificity domain
VAEKGKALAEESGIDDKVGKVFINATSGFANVHLSIWQHTIGGYQVLHKWLDDRRKAGRSLSQDDITHWLRVYAALEATQKLMVQVDEAIEANGGWPADGKDSTQCAFSQNHPPPDAVALAREQMAQKDQLKAQKKLSKSQAALTSAASASSGAGTSSLFDFDDDLDGLAAASGAPPRPKARATPAQAAGGNASKRAANAKATLVMSDVADWQVMCAIRAVLARAGAGGLARAELIRQTSREMGNARTSPSIAKQLDDAIRRAVRRGIARNSRGHLTLVARTLDAYALDFLKQRLVEVLAGPWCERTDVPKRFARCLGFARSGAKIEAQVWLLMKSLRRSGLVEVDGRGDLARYRKASKAK